MYQTHRNIVADCAALEQLRDRHTYRRTGDICNVVNNVSFVTVLFCSVNVKWKRENVPESRIVNAAYK